MSYDIKQLAELGAKTRYDQILAEAEAIRKAFPHVTTGTGFRGTVRPLPLKARGKPSKTTMSAEARARISEAQKARWANSRKAAAAAVEPVAPEVENPEVAEAVSEVQTAAETPTVAPTAKKRQRGGKRTKKN